MNTTPWYRDGLHFQCTQCGDCCTGAPGYVWVTEEEIVALAALVGLSVEAFLRKYVRLVGRRKSLIEYANGDCVFFDGERRCCKVYEARPTQCRTWPFWQSNLASPRAWRDTARVCPGCNQGSLVPLEQIERQKGRMKV